MNAKNNSLSLIQDSVHISETMKYILLSFEQRKRREGRAIRLAESIRVRMPSAQ